MLQSHTLITRNEYEQRKRRLDDQLREGVELLQAAHRQQIRALDLVWMTMAEEDLALPPAPPQEAAEERPAPTPVEPPQPVRRRAGQLNEEVEGILDALPEVFDRNDVAEALGYEPDRGSLYRVLQDLARSGVLAVEERGAGKVPTTYSRTQTDAS